MVHPKDQFLRKVSPFESLLRNTFFDNWSLCNISLIRKSLWLKKSSILLDWLSLERESCPLEKKIYKIIQRDPITG